MKLKKIEFVMKKGKRVCLKHKNIEYEYIYFKMGSFMVQYNEQKGKKSMVIKVNIL